MTEDESMWPDTAEIIVAVLLTDLKFDPEEGRQERWISRVRSVMSDVAVPEGPEGQG